MKLHANNLDFIFIDILGEDSDSSGDEDDEDDNDDEEENEEEEGETKEGKIHSLIHYLTSS